MTSQKTSDAYLYILAGSIARRSERLADMASILHEIGAARKSRAERLVSPAQAAAPTFPAGRRSGGANASGRCEIPASARQLPDASIGLQEFIRQIALDDQGKSFVQRWTPQSVNIAVEYQQIDGWQNPNWVVAREAVRAAFEAGEMKLVLIRNREPRTAEAVQPEYWRSNDPDDALIQDLILAREQDHTKAWTFSLDEAAAQKALTSAADWAARLAEIDSAAAKGAASAIIPPAAGDPSNEEIDTGEDVSAGIVNGGKGDLDEEQAASTTPEKQKPNRPPKRIAKTILAIQDKLKDHYPKGAPDHMSVSAIKREIGVGSEVSDSSMRRALGRKK